MSSYLGSGLFLVHVMWTIKVSGVELASEVE